MQYDAFLLNVVHVTELKKGAAMGKNIVVCCDGTGNEIDGNISNVLKLHRIAIQDESQVAYYHPGIGTLGSYDYWARFRQGVQSIFGLATGYGIDEDVLNAYCFICQSYKFSEQPTDPGVSDENDSIFLFGFSRGAYTIRILAAFIYAVGLLRPEQLNLAGYALKTFKQAAERKNITGLAEISDLIKGRAVTIKFVGVWDTVSSVLIPRRGFILPTLLKLPYTRKNPSVRVFRHAMSLDERRRMFRLNRWSEPQPFLTQPFSSEKPREKGAKLQRQDIKQVWFAGVHADIGGGYPEQESGLAKYPLLWLLKEAEGFGLKIDYAVAQQFVMGKPASDDDSKNKYVAPDVAAIVHNSLTKPWWCLEVVPKYKGRFSEKTTRLQWLGWYIPLGDRRIVPYGSTVPRVHQSVLDRMEQVDSYKPPNLPSDYVIEPHQQL